MIDQNLEFFNVDHLERVPGLGGLRLERFPERFRRELGIEANKNGRFRAERVHGCEIRFVTEAPFFDLALSAAESDIDVCLYCGDMAHGTYTLEAGKVTVLHIEKNAIYDTVDLDKLPKGRFSSWVWRVQFGMNGTACFHYLDTFGYEHRPPKPEEKPEITWAAYGSSITCGSVTTLYSNCYIEQAAVRLGAEVMNKGLSGSCFCEEFAADYLASLPVTMLSLEIGVNMIPFLKEEEFEKRVSRFLEAVSRSQAKRIYVIDIFTNKGLITSDHQAPYYTRSRSFCTILNGLVEEKRRTDPRFVQIPGTAVAENLTYLSCDLLHPSDHGHIRMGENLASWIRKEEKKMEKRNGNGGEFYGNV